MKKMKLAFVAVALVAALSAFTTNIFTDHHYVLDNGQLVLKSSFSPDDCDVQQNSQCSYILSTTSTPPATVDSQDPEFNTIISNPDQNGIDKVYVGQ